MSVYHTINVGYIQYMIDAFPYKFADCDKYSIIDDTWSILISILQY